MRFQVLDMLKQPIGSRNQVVIGERRLVLDDDVDLVGLTGAVEFMRTDKGLLVAVEADAAVKAKCSRCLEDAQYQLHLQFEEEYLQTVDALTGLAIAIPGDNENFLIDASFNLNIEEALRQYKLLADPIKILCRVDCLGLCAICGQNLNQAKCNCSAGGDSPWGSLATLKSELSERERSQ